MRDPRSGIYTHATQGAQVDHHPAVARRFPREAVAAAFDRDEQARFTREIHSVLHVRRSLGLHDQRGTLVDRRVQNKTRLLVSIMARQQQIASQAVAELLHSGSLERDARAVSGDGLDVHVDFHRRAQNCSERAAGRQRRRDRRGKRALHKTTSIHDPSQLSDKSHRTPRSTRRASAARRVRWSATPLGPNPGDGQPLPAGYPSA